jgi:hypothetical protein
MQVAELRPLSIGEILDVGIKIVWRHAWTLVRIVVFVVAPVQVVAALVQASAVPDSVIEATYGTRPFDQVRPVSSAELRTAIAAFAVAILLAFVASTIAIGACFKAIADAYLGERPSWRTSLAYAFRRAHSLVWVVIFYYVVVTLGLFLCIAPGVFLGVAWVVAIPALLTEGVRGRRALGRSYRLVRGRWWPSFGLAALALVFAGFVSYAIQLLFFAPLFTDAGDSAPVVLVANVLASVASSAISTPLVAAFATVLYFDLRVRKEGFDLALLAARIGVAPDPARAPLPPRAPAPAAWEDEPSSSQPPYWPPPPGWRPPAPGSAPSGEPETGAASESGSEDPPYWPPPPGWRPRPRAPEAE